MTSKVAVALAALTLTLLPRLAVAQQVETDRLTEAARLAAGSCGLPSSRARPPKNEGGSRA